MNRNVFRTVALGVVAATLVCASSVVEASFLFVDDANAIGGIAANFAQYTFGNEFVVGDKNIVVTSVAYADLGTPGLVDSHQVGIWDLSQTLLGSVTVPSGSGATINGFKYATLGTPLTLLAGQTYILSGDTGGTAPVTSDQYRYGTSFTSGSGISSILGRIQSSVGAGFVYPSATSVTTGEVWGTVNMAYTVVPEPATFTLLVTGLVGLLAYAWRKRK